MSKQTHCDPAEGFCAECRKAAANKAEVEPVAHLKFWARQSWSGNGNHDVEHAEGLEVCKAGDIGDDGEPAFPVYATPPATTGASTVLTDERIKDICNESGFGETGFTLRFARAIEREVAAQAGQVAVPEERIIYEIQTPDGKWLECTQRIYKLAEGGNRRAVKIVPAPRS